MQVMVEKCSRVKPGVLGTSEHSTNPMKYWGILCSFILIIQLIFKLEIV